MSQSIAEHCLSEHSVSPSGQGLATTTVRLTDATPPRWLTTAKRMLKNVPGSASVSIPQPCRKPCTNTCRSSHATETARKTPTPRHAASSDAQAE